MYVDGKKYACDACVRGHRVSGCNHNDRPLQEIAKKGRPVSQCQHCRSLRKSRSSHVKCDCGEKTKGAPKHHYINENGKLVELDESKEGSHCQCPHGGRCTCSVKKEYLECVPETTTSTPGSTASTSSDAPRAKPRLQSTQSESSLTRFTNGHHKAVRHHAHGTAPYHIPAHHHHPAPSDNCHEKITDVDLSSRHGHIIMPSDPEDVPAVFPRSGLSRQIKSENGSPSVASSGYQDGGETALPPTLTRNISDFNLPGSRGVFELSVRTTDLPAFDTFDTPDYSAHDFFVSAVDSEAGFPFSTNYNPPNSATWPYEGNHVENFCEVPPGLTRSVSGDDSEVENNWAYPTLPSPAHNITPGYLNGPFSAESSDFYESDHHDGLSTVSSRVGLANIGTLPTADLGSMESYLNTAFDSSTFNLGVQDGMSLTDLGFEDIRFEDGKTLPTADIGPLSTAPERNSQLFADSEVLMMVPVTSQNVPMPPDFETR